jgi:hypothetical protein
MDVVSKNDLSDDWGKIAPDLKKFLERGLKQIEEKKCEPHDKVFEELKKKFLRK